MTQESHAPASVRTLSRRAITLLSLVLVSACQAPARDTGGSAPGGAPNPAASDSEAVRTVVQRFGERLQRVSLLGPRSDRVAALRREYGALVAPPLLVKWSGDSGAAPGRRTSSPWPDHIDVESMVRGPDGGYTVTAEVVERTSADAAGSASNRIPVRLTVARVGDRWLIASYEQPSDSRSDDDAPDGAARVLREYYRALDERRYVDAYRLWGSRGAASGKSFDEFQSGFSETVTVEATLGAPGPMGAAAGSRYVEVPVRVVARLRSGAGQEFTGSYTLRRSVVDGATPEQRVWHIDSAKLRQVR